MTEQISTPDVTTATDTSTVSAPETTTTNEVVTDTAATETKEPETEQNTAEIKQDETTQEEPPKLYANKYKSVEELEKGYNEAQKYVSKVAELEKQIREMKEPKIVNENGKIDKSFETQYLFDIDNQEFLAYDNLARRLEPETRQEVENLLQEAKNLYFYDKNAYANKMNEVEQYFNPNVIKTIARNKDKALAEMQTKFNEAKQAQKLERGKGLVAEVEAMPELYNVLNEQSENYIPEVFGVFKDIFETHGTVDVKSFNEALNKVKELGKKEYIASLEREKAKEQAKVPSGTNAKVENKKGEVTGEQLESLDFWNNFYS